MSVCEHRGALCWPGLMWCRTCGAVNADEAGDIPEQEWVLPSAAALALPDSDAFNRWGVGSTGERVRICVPLPPFLTNREALQLAAYLVAVADTSLGHADFLRLLDAVESA